MGLRWRRARSREDRRHLLQRHGQRPPARAGGRRGRGGSRRRGAAAPRRGARLRAADLAEPVLGAASLGGRRGARRVARRPRLGRRRRVRVADPLRKHRRPAEAVHRPGRRALAGREAGRQGRHELHGLADRPRRPGDDDPRAPQHALPLGNADPAARLHGGRGLRGGRQPVRRVLRHRPHGHRPRRGRPGGRAVPGPAPRPLRRRDRGGPPQRRVRRRAAGPGELRRARRRSQADFDSARLAIPASSSRALRARSRRSARRRRRRPPP